MIEYLVKKRKITIMVFALLIIVGLLSFLQLPKQEMPDVVVKQAIVTTVYPGATPEKMEQTVTKVIEQKIKEIQDIKTISSTSESGISTITIEAQGDADAKKKWDELRKKVKDVEAELPKDANQPVINDDLTKAFIQSFVIYADSPKDLYKLNDLMLSWKDQLRSVPLISQVTIKGIPDQEVRIDIDTEKLQQYNLSWQQVIQALRNDNERYPLGNLSYNERKYQLTLSDIENADAFNNVIISRTKDGSPLYLQDVGLARLSYADPDYFAYYKGKPAITINVSGETGSDVPTLDQAVSKKMDQLKKNLPAETKLVSVYAQKDKVNQIFSSLSREMIIAILAVIIVCTLGLNMITSGVVALAIPISISLGLLLLPILGITLNQITVIGLIIVLGILVDDAVVVNDNIERRLSVLKESPFTAAVNGTKEVAISIIIATLATISSFAPLLMLTGDMGSFIKPIPTVIIFSMLASMAMSLTIIPIFRSWYEDRRKRKTAETVKPAGLLGKQIEGLTYVYSKRIMTKVVKHPILVGFSGLFIGTAAYGLVPFTPIELFPNEETPQFTINVELPTGSSINETNRVINDVTKWVMAQPGVKKVTSAAGGSAPQAFSTTGSLSKTGDEVGQIAVVGEEGKLSVEKTIVNWKEKFKDMYPGMSVVPEVPQSGPPVGKPISIRISGESLDQMASLAQQVKQVVADTEGAYDIKDDVGIERYTLDFQVNKAMMDQNLVNANDLSATLRLISEGMSAGEFDTGQDLIDINVYLQKENDNPATLFQRLSVTNARGEQIPLAQIAQMKPSFSVSKINRYNLSRTVTIEAEVEGRTATEAMTEIKQKLNQMNFPEGYSWQAGGETSDQADSFKDLGKLFIIVIFIIIMLIAIQFYSISIPFIVMTTVYLAIAGGIIGLFLTRTPIGFMTVMGLIALAGIVVRNGIVLIEFIEKAREAGIELKEAVLQATAARFRPILLTSLTAIVGLLPIAIIGEILFRPMAVTIISGLIFSTVLTLVVVPSLYIVLANYKSKRQQKKFRIQNKSEMTM